MRNPVRASAAGSWDAAELSEGHGAGPREQKALRVVQAMLDGSARGVSLGRGNFGEAFEVRRGASRVIVKVPVAADIQGRPWQMSSLRQFFRQEAGVANDLWDAGSPVVPRTTYVEHDEIPYLVREWGEIPAGVTPAEFDWLGDQLSALMSAGWRIRDDLLVARRPKGSLFVADVGMWTKRRRGSAPEARDAWEDLWSELGKFSAAQAWAPSGKWWTDRVVASAAEIRHARMKLKAYVARAKDKKGDDFMSSWYGRQVTNMQESLARKLETRRSVGLS